MELIGKIISVLEKRTGVAKLTGTPWAVQSYVLETHNQYPRKMCFEVFGEDKINLFAIKAGEELTVSFDIDAREYQGRWYNTMRAWDVKRVAKGNETNNIHDVPVLDPFSLTHDSVDFTESEEPLPF